MAIARRRSFQVLNYHDSEKLKSFYTMLSFDARRARFGGGVCDQSIADYCQTLDWHRAIIIARMRAYSLDAVMEIHPLDSKWDRAEVALYAPPQNWRLRAFAHLLQLGALMAGERGCATFVIHLDPSLHDVPHLLADMGTMRIEQGTAIVDLGEYARIAIDPVIAADQTGVGKSQAFDRGIGKGRNAF